jgi:hypothetical protein
MFTASNVAYWHNSDLPSCLLLGRFRKQSGNQAADRRCRHTAKNPELVAAFMITCAIDFGTAVIARALEDGHGKSLQLVPVKGIK